MSTAPSKTTEVKTQIEAAKLLRDTESVRSIETPSNADENVKAAHQVLVPFQPGDYVHVKTVTMYYGGYLLRVVDFYGHAFLQLGDASWIIDMGRDVAECGRGDVADLSRFIPGTTPLIHVDGIIEMFQASPLKDKS